MREECLLVCAKQGCGKHRKPRRRGCGQNWRGHTDENKRGNGEGRGQYWLCGVMPKKLTDESSGA